MRDADAYLRRSTALSDPMPLQGDFDVDDDGRLDLIAKLTAKFPWFVDDIGARDERLILRH